MPNPNENALSIRELSVTFDSEDGAFEAVRNVSYDVPRGKVLAVVGESGSGKSVTANAILGLIQSPGRVSNGQILFFPQQGDPVNITTLSEKDDLLFEIRGGKIGMIFQEPMTALSPVHTIGNQLCEALFLHKSVDKTEAERVAIEMLEKVGITDPATRLKQYPHEFSGGMRQRVVIAMALICEPEIIIADEPTTALDVTIQAQILTLLSKLQKETGTSVIFITHDLGVVAQIADDVAVMYKGRIVEKGSVRQVLKDPLHPYTKALLAAIPSQKNLGARLPTIDSVLGNTDISTHTDLIEIGAGRSVALAPEEAARHSQ